MASWQKLVALTFGGALLVSACEISTGDDDNDDFWDDDSGVSGSGNRAGQGAAGRAGAGAGGVAGSGVAGSATGGTAAGTGGSPSAGTGNTAGEDGIADDLVCSDEEQGKTPWAGECNFSDDADPRYKACLSCLGASCCSEIRQCYAENPSSSCGWGVAGPDALPEYLCYFECLADAIEDHGFPDEDDQQNCALSCGTLQDGAGRQCTSTIVSDPTLDMVQCMDDNCFADCVEDLAEL